MSKVRFLAAASLFVAGVFFGGQANAAVPVEKVQAIVVKDVAPADDRPLSAPLASSAPTPAQAAAQRGRPGPQFHGLVGAVTAPAQAGAGVANFMARTIAKAIVGAEPAEADKDPA
ncbi:MAG TPA: hypothetical protein VG983_03640 [Caulobacterales bacterium]|nr:hypothetical protein [Caulobacterales bacterium]